MSFCKADTFIIIVILAVLFQSGSATPKHARLTDKGEIDRFSDLDSLSEAELSALYNELKRDDENQPNVVKDIFLVETDGKNGNTKETDTKPHSKKSIKSSNKYHESKKPSRQRNNKHPSAHNGETEESPTGNLMNSLNVTFSGTVDDHGLTHLEMDKGDKGMKVNNATEHSNQPIKTRRRHSKGSTKQTGAKHGKGHFKSNQKTKPTSQPRISNPPVKKTVIKHKGADLNTDADFDKALETAMRVLSAHSKDKIANDNTSGNKNKLSKAKGKDKVIIVRRISATDKRKSHLSQRKNTLFNALKDLCSPSLSMCNIEIKKDTDADDDDEDDDDDDDDDDNDDDDDDEKKLKIKNMVIKLLMLLASKARTKSPSNIPASPNKNVPTSRKAPTWKGQTMKAQTPVSDSQRAPGGASADAIISPPINSTPVYADKAVWIGIAVGTGTAWLMMLLLYGWYRCLLHYKSERKNEQMGKLCIKKDGDDSPMRIRMAKMSKDKSGNHYVVSIMDDKEKEDEEGWSSEEEVYNVSGARDSPRRTSTPLGTPVKKKLIP